MRSFLKYSLFAFLLLSLVESYAKVLPGIQDFGGNKLTHIPNGATLRKARYDLIFSATNSIYLSTFTIEPDEVGKEIFDLLCYKAKLGMEVRLITDYGSSEEFADHAQKLRECGAHVIQFEGDLFIYAVHHKLLIVDGERMIMGGSNSIYKYHLAAPNSDRRNSPLRQVRKSGWYDSDYKIEGPGACAYHYKFRDTFKHYVRHLADRNAHFVINRLLRYGSGNLSDIVTKYYGLDEFRKCVSTSIMGSERIIPLIGMAYKNDERPILNAHLAGIEQAEKGEKILLYSPYFVPGKKFAEALASAAKRGVDVNIITNSVESSDEGWSGVLFLGMIETVRDMLKQGVKIHLWNLESTIHRKGGVYGKVAFFGSDNLDNRGQEYSDESVAFTDSKEIVGNVIKEHMNDVRRGTIPLTESYIQRIRNKSSWFEKKAGKHLKKYF